MARQPFHPQYADSSTQMASSLIEKMPKLADLVGRITINWSGVDLQLSLLLGSLLGINSFGAVAVFLSLRNHRSQRDALEAAANKCLSSELLDGFNTILKSHKELDKQRNDVVHGVWGIAPKTPDGIIWSSLQDHANMLINDYHLMSTGKVSSIDRTYNISRDYFVYRYSDLEKLNFSIMLLGEAIQNFHVFLRYRDQPAGKNAWKNFCSNSLISKKMENLHCNAEKPPLSN